MISPRIALRAARALGLRSSAHYIQYQAALKSGWIRRRTPLSSWQSFQPTPVSVSDPAKTGGNFFWESSQWQPPRHFAWAQAARDQAEQQARQILEGRFQLFGMHSVELGFPPDWHAFPPLDEGISAGSVDPTRHWSDYALDSFEADIKLLWEPSRMGWVFALGRAYRWSEEPEFGAAFWRLFQSWCDSHQVNAGPHWISAQEVAFRIIALGFARTCFGPWLKEEQQKFLTAVVRAHAFRIRPTVAYSRSQRNNHLLSEAVGLLTAGLLFPEVPEADAWTRSGFRWLVDGLDDQIFADGGYIQHSINYGRLALDLGLWSNILCSRNGLKLPQRSTAALVRLADWLGDMVEPVNGLAPNLGPNDGTQVLPLTSCSYSDYRPSLQAARATLGGKAPYAQGPWDELTSWFGTEPSPRRIKRRPARQDHPQAGIFTMGADTSHGYLRAARFHSRPGHLDQLHVDLWRNGRNVALDPGTYLYNGRPPWDNQFVSAMNHNTVVIDGQEPMQKAGRFLWIDWSRAWLIEKIRSQDGDMELATASHDGYRSIGVRQRRSVLRAGEDLWLVIDDLAGDGFHEVYLPWLLPMVDWQADNGALSLKLAEASLRLSVQVEGGTSSLYSAGNRLHGVGSPVEPPQWGWRSLTYAHKEPALHWVSYWRGNLPLQLRTWWCFNGAQPDDLELRWEEGALPQLRTVHLGGTTLRR